MLLSALGLEINVILRALSALLCSLVLVLVLGKPVIALLHKHQHHGQPIRTDASEVVSPERNAVSRIGICFDSICDCRFDCYADIWINRFY